MLALSNSRRGLRHILFGVAVAGAVCALAWAATTFGLPWAGLIITLGYMYLFNRVYGPNILSLDAAIFLISSILSGGAWLWLVTRF